MSGKGDQYRPVNRDKFNENFDRIFKRTPRPFGNLYDSVEDMVRSEAECPEELLQAIKEVQEGDMEDCTLGSGKRYGDTQLPGSPELGSSSIGRAAVSKTAG